MIKNTSLILLLAATPLLSAAQDDVIDQAVLPKELTDGVQIEVENYLLAPLDSVTITVFEEPDLNVSQRISARGEIFMPLLGAVQITGLSVEQVKARLENLFVEEEYLRNPSVTVAISGFSPKRITFLGEISTSIPLPDGANFLELETAIAMAGGMPNTGRDSGLRITRTDETGTARVITVNLNDILGDDAGIRTERFRVFPGDLIYVPRRIF